MSEELAHRSYLIGAGDEAAVIDPSRDIDCYLQDAVDGGFKITRIFETHRSEDYINLVQVRRWPRRSVTALRSSD